MARENSHNEKFKELCAGYVLQALDEDERKEFEHMLADATEEQQRLYHELQSIASQMVFTGEKSESSESRKNRLLAQHREESGKDEQISSTPASTIDEEPDKDKEDKDEATFDWATFSAAASFALLIVSLSLLFYSFNLSSEINDKESDIDDQQAEIAELENELRQKEEMLTILESRDVDMVLLSGLEVNPEGYGKVIWDTENRQALLQVSNLPTVPSDKDYQLWIIRDNEPVSAGVFAVSDTSDNFFKFEEMAETEEVSANAFAITMEPKGGMPQPTGDMYLLGNMNGGTEDP